MDALSEVFEKVAQLYYKDWELVGLVLFVGLVVGAVFGRWMGRYTAVVELKALRAERDAALRERSAADQQARLRANALEEEKVRLGEAQRLLGEKDLAIAQADGERDRAVAHSEETGRRLGRLRNAFSEDIWLENWSDARADGGGAEQVFGKSPFPIIAIGNLKGGVGKTTIAGNLGAFLAARANLEEGLKPVLFIDLDFQGSLSATMLYEAGLAAEAPAPSEIDFRVKELFRGDLSAQDKLSMARSFVRPEISRSAFYDCDYPAFRLEDELLYDWVLESGPKLDVRLRVAEFLYSPVVRERFGAVVLDLPPRTTTFSVNALCAATDLIIPARTDDLALKAIPRFVGQLKRYRETLWPQLRICGVVGTMTQRFDPSETETAELANALAQAEDLWEAPQPPIANLGTIPAKSSISANAGRKFQYFVTNDGSHHPPHDIFKAFGERVLSKLSRLPT